VAEFTVRSASPADAREMAELFAAVAEERTGIASEPPVDIEERAAQFAGTTDGSIVAVAGGQLVGILHVEVSRHGFGEIGMLVRRDWRGHGIGSALLRESISRARDQGPAQALPGGVRAQHRWHRPVPQVRLRRGGAARQAVPASQR